MPNSKRSSDPEASSLRSGRHPRTIRPIPRSSRLGGRSVHPHYSPSAIYEKENYRQERVSGTAIGQIGLRIVSLFLAGVVIGCSIRSYVTGLILWLPLSIAIIIWEVAELLFFAVNRTHGIPSRVHIIAELLLSLAALAYTGLSIYETFVFHGYRSIVEFVVAGALCTVISAIHTILFVCAVKDIGSMRRSAAVLLI